MGHPGPIGPEPPFPDSGTWYSDERRITMFLDQGKGVVVIGSDKVSCDILRERGSYDVYLNCALFDHEKYDFGHCLFSGHFLTVHGDIFYLEEHESGIVYAFKKVTE